MQRSQPQPPAGDVHRALDPGEHLLERYRRGFRDAPYYSSGRVWDDYAPAYRYGLECAVAHRGRRFEEIEAELAHEWERLRGASRLTWAEARRAVQAAWRDGLVAPRGH